MGVLFNRTSHLKLLFLCFVFINNLSVSIMFSVERSIEAQIPADEFLDEEEFEQKFNFEEHELENIKRTMIEGLGFRKVPDVTKMNVSQEEYSKMYDLYLSRLEQRQIEDKDSSIENVPKFYTFHPKDRHLRRKRRRGVIQMTFNISSNPHTSVEHSTLRLLTGNADQTGPVRVQVYQIVVSRDGKRLRRIVDERDIYLVAGAPKWCEFDVTSAMRSWIEHYEPNLGLELHCPEFKSSGYPIIQENDSPVINALMSVHESTRGKRSAEQMLFYEKNRRTDCHDKNRKRCCRHKMDFDLSQLGFNFIIQPKKFDGGICKGRCPPQYNAANNHAIIQSMMWKKNKNLTPRVCCAPSKLEHLEILTVNEDNPEKLAVKRWDNMIVLECACS